MPQICQKLDVGAQKLGRWQQQFRGMGGAEIKRLKQLEEENRRPRKAVTDLILEKLVVTEIVEGKQ